MLPYDIRRSPGLDLSFRACLLPSSSSQRDVVYMELSAQEFYVSRNAQYSCVVRSTG
jgi:hypothetical protein